MTDAPKISDTVNALMRDLETSGARVTPIALVEDEHAEGLTVAELIVQLQRLPQSWRVKVQVGATDMGDGMGISTWRGVEGWEAGDGEVLLLPHED